MKLSWFHNSSHDFCVLTRVDLDRFIVFFKIEFFQFHSLKMSLLKIERYN
jgi:hypothetical protein